MLNFMQSQVGKDIIKKGQNNKEDDHSYQNRSMLLDKFVSIRHKARICL